MGERKTCLKELFYFICMSVPLESRLKCFLKSQLLKYFTDPHDKEHILYFSHYLLICWMRETQNCTLSFFFIFTYSFNKSCFLFFFIKVLTQMKDFFFFNVKLTIYGKYLCEILVWFWLGSILIFFKLHIWYVNINTYFRFFFIFYHH